MFRDSKGFVAKWVIGRKEEMKERKATAKEKKAKKAKAKKAKARKAKAEVKARQKKA